MYEESQNNLTDDEKQPEINALKLPPIDVLGIYNNRPNNTTEAGSKIRKSLFNLIEQRI